MLGLLYGGSAVWCPCAYLIRFANVSIWFFYQLWHGDKFFKSSDENPTPKAQQVQGCDCL